MEGVLEAMVMAAPIGLSLIGCVAFGYALEAREALGRDRGLREAAERARDAAIRTLSGSKEWEMQEIGRFRRLLDCHFDALIAEATEFRERAVPSPGGILESLCSWNADWRRELAVRARLRLEDVDRLVKNDLPITPSLARQLEAFTGAPARYWEYLWRLYDDYRMEMDETMVVRLGELSRAREVALRAQAPAGAEAATSAGAAGAPSTRRDRRREPKEVEDTPAAAMAAPFRPFEPAPPAEPPACPQPPPAPEPPPAPPSPPPARRSAVEVHPPAVAHPELAVRGQRGRLPPPPVPRLRSPVASGGASGGEAARRAITLTDFPVQGEGPLPASGDGWSETERSALNQTLRGVGG